MCPPLLFLHSLHPFAPAVLSPAAKSCQTNSQPKTFSFLSQLALSSQNKFFLRSPPKFRKRAAGGSAAPDCLDGYLEDELDGEGDTSEGQSPTTLQYENCLSAGLDCAISDLVSLDSQAEVDQGSTSPPLSFQIQTGCSSSLRLRRSSCTRKIPNSLPLFDLLAFCNGTSWGWPRARLAGRSHL